MALKLSEMSLSSPPDPQDPLGVMLSTGCHRNRDPGQSTLRPSPTFCKEQNLPPNISWHVGLSPLGCLMVPLQGAIAGDLLWTYCSEEGCQAQGCEVVCPSSAAASQLPLEGLSSSVFATSVLYGPHTVVKS